MVAGLALFFQKTRIGRALQVHFPRPSDGKKLVAFE